MGVMGEGEAVPGHSWGPVKAGGGAGSLKELARVWAQLVRRRTWTGKAQHASESVKVSA